LGKGKRAKKLERGGDGRGKGKGRGGVESSVPHHFNPIFESGNGATPKHYSGYANDNDSTCCPSYECQQVDAGNFIGTFLSFNVTWCLHQGVSGTSNNGCR